MSGPLVWCLLVSPVSLLRVWCDQYHLLCINSLPNQQFWDILLWYPFKQERCNPLIKGLLDRAPKTNCAIERRSEGNRSIVTNAILHADYAINGLHQCQGLLT